MVATGSLLLEVRRFENLWLVEHLRLDSVRIQLNVQAPLFDLLRLCDHLVELLDRVDAVLRLLEEALAHLRHGLLILTHLLRDADQHRELRGQVDVLPLLLDFKQRLTHLSDLHVVLLFEIAGHGDGRAGLALLEVARLGAHVEAHIAHLVRLVVTVHGHDDSALELVDDGFLKLLVLGHMVRVALAFHSEALHLIVNQLKAIVNRQILADVVYDQVEAALEDPGRSEEAGPGLHSIVEGLGLGAHEEARVAADLAQVAIAHLRLDDGVDEVEGEGVLLHAHLIEVIELEFADALNQNCKFTTEEETFRLKVNFIIVAGRGENVVTDADVVDENFLKQGHLVLVAEDLVLLERFEVVDVEVADDTCAVFVGVHDLDCGH